MVYTLATTSEEEEEYERVTAAPTPAMSSERAPKPLHNFSLPWDLKWGSQRHLRCMKVEDSSSDADAGAVARLDRRRSDNGAARRREIEGGFERRTRPGRRPRIDVVGGGDGGAVEMEEEGIEAVREKLMFEFKTAADKMKDAILRGGEGTAVVVAPARFSPVDADMADEDDDMEEEEGEIVAVAAAEEGGGGGSPAAAVRPWNLRTRRAACKAPIKGLRIEERKVNSSPLRSEGGAKSPRLVRAVAAAAASGSGVEKERPKFSVSLSKKEIDEDFMKMLGHRAPRRPKKQPRAVQKLLEGVFPATWLTEVSADLYKVPEFPETVKR